MCHLMASVIFSSISLTILFLKIVLFMLEVDRVSQVEATA